MNWLIVVLFLTGVAGTVTGLFMRKDEGCAVMLVSSILAAAMIILGIGAIAWKLVSSI